MLSIERKKRLAGPNIAELLDVKMMRFWISLCSIAMFKLSRSLTRIYLSFIM